jgi:hypothetical protein
MRVARTLSIAMSSRAKSRDLSNAEDVTQVRGVLRGAQDDSALHLIGHTWTILNRYRFGNRPYLLSSFICRKYSWSQAAGMDSRGEYGPG